jgi:hypothetical protein
MNILNKKIPWPVYVLIGITISVIIFALEVILIK